MKKLYSSILTLALLFVALPAFAATETVVINPATDTNNLVFSTPIKLTSISIANQDAASATFKFFDSNLASAHYTNAAYDLNTQYVASVITTFTNFSGVVQTHTNSMLISTNLTIAENEAAGYRVLSTITAAASTTTLISFADPVFVNLGLFMTNTATTNATVNITYSN